ncbi:PAS domain-containing sensor histidine kinase [Nocardioides caldifontis]|uniref:PAS domain-containing sensor histidine kinase n=1 Tax=Nocardioides caldifontis TaxID=2588938 RepID=UPI0011DFEA23|nr:PAS domain-containing sensor histidine kinase [Nocardioides caldifontis]
MTDSGREVLRSLGIEALLDILETTSYGVAVTGPNHSWVYLNPAGERLFGRRFDELRGRDYLQHFPDHEREVLLRLEDEQREGDTEFYTNTVLRPDGTERRMTWSGTAVEVDGVELAPAIFHETTPLPLPRRPAPSTGDRAVPLASLLGDAVAGTRATAAALLLEGPTGELQVAAAARCEAGLADAVAASGALLSDLPGTGDLARGRSVYLSDAADRFAAGPRTAGWAPLLADAWSGAVLFGVRCDDRTAGCLVVALPPALTSPSESEVAHWSSVADQVGVVIGAELVREQVSQHSALVERNRIARDLHDSVSQALFSVHARAQVIRRALGADDRDLALEAAEDLELLSRQATSELRELVGELRRSQDVGSDVGESLRALAAEITRLEGLPVEVSFSPANLPLLPAPLGEHVPRIVREALHNTVKHARASNASVHVTADRDRVSVRIHDDGLGFEPGTTDGFGQHTMRERAELCGGTLSVRSRPGEGTTVSLDVPLG